MSYDVTVSILIKTFGKKLTHSQMRKKIEDALWDCEEFRDVDLYEYIGDTENDEGIVKK